MFLQYSQSMIDSTKTFWSNRNKNYNVLIRNLVDFLSRSKMGQSENSTFIS